MLERKRCRTIAIACRAPQGRKEGARRVSPLQSPVRPDPAGALSGGVWVWLALGYLTVQWPPWTRLIATAYGNADPEAEFPHGTPLLVAIGLAHFTCSWRSGPSRGQAA